MHTYIVILRGINVSGKKILPMEALRALLVELKFEQVKTYIQSGNIIVNSRYDKEVVIEKIATGIKNKFGYVLPVFAKTITEWEMAVANNPYPVDNQKIVSFTFLSRVPECKSVEVNTTNNDVFTVFNDMVYMYCPNGFGRSKLTNNLFEKKLKVTATSRNYRTTIKLLALAKENALSCK